MPKAIGKQYVSIIEDINLGKVGKYKCCIEPKYNEPLFALNLVKLWTHLNSGSSSKNKLQTFPAELSLNPQNSKPTKQFWPMNQH